MRTRFALVLGSVVAAAAVNCGSSDDGEGAAGSGGTSQAGKGGSGGQGGKAGKGGAPAGGAAGSLTRGGEGGAAGDSERVCVPGETQTCLGPGACDGAQACRDDGRGWSACDCGSGASGGSGGGGEGGAGTGGAGGEPGTAPCEPLEQTGCPGGEKCSVVTSGTTQTRECTPEGDLQVDDACTIAGDGSDDCEAGARCLQVTGMSEARCLPYCNALEAYSCYQHDELPNCDSFALGGGAYGVCVPGCDLLSQDCTDATCAMADDGTTSCAPNIEPPTAPGADCSFTNECGPTGVCAFLNDARDSNMCTTLCNAAESGSCTNGTEACVPIAGLIEGAQTGAAGTCLPCDYFDGFSACSLLLAGGCDEEVDCDPLTTQLAGLEFACEKPSGRCVLEEN